MIGTLIDTLFNYDLSGKADKVVFIRANPSTSPFCGFRIQHENEVIDGISSLRKISKMVTGWLESILKREKEENAPILSPVEILHLIDNLHWLNNKIDNHNRKISNCLLWNIINIFLRVITLGFFGLTYNRIDPRMIVLFQVAKCHLGLHNWKKEEIEKALELLAKRKPFSRDRDLDPLRGLILGKLAFTHVKTEQAFSDYTKIMVELEKRDTGGPQIRHKEDFPEGMTGEEMMATYPQHMEELCSHKEAASFCLGVLKQLALLAKEATCIKDANAILNIAFQHLRWIGFQQNLSLDNFQPHVTSYTSILEALERNLGEEPLINLLVGPQGIKGSLNFIMALLIPSEHANEEHNKLLGTLWQTTSADSALVLKNVKAVIPIEGIVQLVHEYYTFKLATIVGKAALHAIQLSFKSVILKYWKIVENAAKYSKLFLNDRQWKTLTVREGDKQWGLLTALCMIENQRSLSEFSLDILHRCCLSFPTLADQIKLKLKKIAERDDLPPALAKELQSVLPAT